MVGKAFRIYCSVRTDALPQCWLLFAVLDGLGHPSWIRCAEFGTVSPEERQRLRIFNGCADNGSNAARHTWNAIPPSRGLARTMRVIRGAPECEN